MGQRQTSLHLRSFVTELVMVVGLLAGKKRMFYANIVRFIPHGSSLSRVRWFKFMVTVGAMAAALTQPPLSSRTRGHLQSYVEGGVGKKRTSCVNIARCYPIASPQLVRRALRRPPQGLTTAMTCDQLSDA